MRLAFSLAVLPLLAGCHLLRPSGGASVLDAAGNAGAGPALHAAVGAARVVYVGESHDDREHHRFQLRILETMHAAGGAPMLGMEMFQRPAQPHLDDYVAGRIDERQMLRRTEYFTRWRFDYTLYAPLWRFCRAQGLRVIALNAEAEVVSKVGKSGLASLTPEERAKLPAEIDLDVASHRKRVRGVLERVHPLPEDRMQAFYEAQTCWDETMADSAARALLAEGPAARMLVIAGSQHIQQWDGIPDRVARRVPDARGVVVVLASPPESRVPEDPGALGDFVVAFPYRAPRRAPGLGAHVQADEGGLRLTRTIAGGTAAAAGLLPGDVLLAIGDAVVTDLTDLRYALDPLPKGLHVTLHVRRDGNALEVPAVLRVTPRPITVPRR